VVQRIVVTRAGEVLRRLWCVASVLHFVAVWCSALQCAVECCSVVQSVAVTRSSDAATYTNVAVCCSVLQSVAVCSSQSMKRHASVLDYVAMFCIMLQ